MRFVFADNLLMGIAIFDMYVRGGRTRYACKLLDKMHNWNLITMMTFIIIFNKIPIRYEASISIIILIFVEKDELVK